MTRVAIIGAGLLGRGIAATVARAGFSVVLHDSNPTVLQTAAQHVNEIAAPLQVPVGVETDLRIAAGRAELMIEAIVEDLALKQSVFEVAGSANDSAVLMSNSSVLPIGLIARRTRNPQRTIGTHWWNPPDLIPIVEVIRGPYTLTSVINRTMDFLRVLGKTPVRVERDVPGFVGNRIQHALWREALALVSGGIAPERVDGIVRATLGRSLAARGPYAEMAMMGSKRLIQEFEECLPLLDNAREPAKRLLELVRTGDLGAKTGRGFYEWPVGRRESIARRLQEHVHRRLQQPLSPSTSGPPKSPEDTEILRRLRLAIWREALSMVESGVCTGPTVDLVVTQTIGLRLSVMGPVENADFVGLDLTRAIHEAVLPDLDASRAVPPSLIRDFPATEFTVEDAR